MNSRYRELFLVSAVVLYGSLMFKTLLPTFNITFGDDGVFNGHMAMMYLKAFPFYLWEPYYYAGHLMTGFGETVYFVVILFMKLGLGISAAFSYSFWLFFVLMGVGIYLYAKQLSPTLIALGLPFLWWSSAILWDATIWGGSYDRAFSTALFFIGAAVTYKFISENAHPNPKWYLATLFTWVAIIFSDKHIAFQFLFFAPLFIVFAGTSIWGGLKRMLTLLVPALTITFVDWGRMAYYLMMVPHAAQYGSEIFPVTWLFIQGLAFQSTVGYLPLPIILLFMVLPAYYAINHRLKIAPARRGLLIAIALPAIYYFIVGWVPELWPYVPRIEGPLDNVANLGALFILAIPALVGAVIDASHNAHGSNIRRFGPNSFSRILVTVLFLVMLVNTAIVLPEIVPANFGPYFGSGNAALASFGVYANASNYRAAISDPYILSWSALYNQSIETTDGRIPILDARPLYTSWFNDVVFYSGVNSSNLTFPQSTEGPTPLYESYFTDSTANAAPSLFWLDWYGAKTVIIDQYEPAQMTLATRELQPYFAAQTYANSSQNSQFAALSTPYAGAISEETNAKIVGFIGNTTEYNLFLALLSYLGLGPSHIIPIRLTQADLNKVPIDALLVGNPTNTTMLAPSTINDIPVVMTTVDSLNHLISLGSTGSYELVSTLFPSLFTNTLVTAPPRIGNSFPINMPISTWAITRLSPNINPNPTWHTWRFGASHTQDVNFTYPVIQAGATTYISTFSQFPAGIQPNDVTLSIGLQSNVAGVVGLTLVGQGFARTYTDNLDANHSNALVLNASDFKQATPTNSSASGIYVNFVSNATASSDIKNISFELLHPQLTIPSAENNSVYSLSSEVSVSPTTYLEVTPLEQGNATMMIMNRTSSEVALRIPLNNAANIIPLTDFYGSKLNSFDVIVTSRPMKSISIVTTQTPVPQPLAHQWNTGMTGMTGTISGAQSGFKGIIFKETYYQNWNFYAQNNIKLPYYYAGPGMMYLPLPTNVTGTIQLSFNPYDWIFFTGVAMAAATLIALSVYVVIERRRNGMSDIL